MAESIEARHENWLRVVWGLLYLKEGLQEYVHTKSKLQYQMFRNNVMRKCNNQTCNQCQVNSKCQNGITKKTGKSPFKSGHFCYEMNREVQSNHVTNTPFWVNTDSTQWQDPLLGHWEVTKCYLSTSGYFDKTGPNQLDASGLLSICINSFFINKSISNIRHFEEVRSIRNNTLHDAHYEFDRPTEEDFLDKMIDVLQDPHELVHNASAKNAADHIRNIKERSAKTPVFMSEALEKWLHTNLDVESALKETEARMFERLRKELKEELTHYIDEENGLKDKLADSYGKEIKRRRIEVQDAKLTVLKTKLIRNILENNSTLQLNPIVQHQESMLVDFYEPPHMSKTVPETGDKDSKSHKPDNKHKKVQKHLSKFEELFISNQCSDAIQTAYTNRVYISGEAGMGKTSFCQYLALAWCAVHGDSEECVRMKEKMKRFKLFNDIEYLKETQLLFLLHLRDFENESDCMKMLKTYLQSDLGYSDGDINDLLSHINSSETILLMDGLDEWQFTANKLPKYSSVSEARIICTSRPWKIDSCVTARMQDYNKISITGIGFDFVERLVRNVTTCLRQERVDVRDNTADFIQILHSKELKEIIYLNASALDKTLLVEPVVILQLLCLWHDGKDFGRTRTQVYINMSETLLRRMKKKYGKQYLNTSENSQLQVYTTMGAECCIQHSENIAKLSTVAFYLLFTGPTEHSLQFSKKDLSSLKLSGRKNQEIIEMFKEIKQFCLNSGIIQGTARKSSSCQDKIYSFIHKTYQEFFAALHIVARKCDANIFQEIVANTKTLQDVIELANVFDFVCGSDSTCIESMVSLIDDLTTKHAMKSDDYMRIELMKMIQDMIFDSCFKNVNEGKVSINLSNLIVDDSNRQNQVLSSGELTKLLRNNEDKLETHHLEITLNKKLGVIFLNDLTLTPNMDVSQVDMEELIMRRVRTGCWTLSKIKRLKRIYIEFYLNTSISIPFQYAQNLTYLELKNCSLSGQLDLSQCPLKVLKVEHTLWYGPLKLPRSTMKKMERMEIKSIVKDMYFTIDFTHSNTLKYLSLSNLSLPGQMDLSACPLKLLELSEVVTGRVIVDCLEECTLEGISCPIEFSNFSKLTGLDMSSCSLSGPMDLSQFSLKRLQLSKVLTERVIVDCVEKFSLASMSCLIDFTNASTLRDLDIVCSSLQGPLDLSQRPLKRLYLAKVVTERVIVGPVEECTIEDMSRLIEFKNVSKRTDLDISSCSIPGPLDLSQRPLKRLNLFKVVTEGLTVGFVETCTLQDMSCLIDFTNVSNLTDLDMWSCSLPGPLDLSQCPLDCLELTEVVTERVIVGCVEVCSFKNMSCLIEFTNVSKLTYLKMSSCSLPGPLDLSQCPLEGLELSEVVTERVIVCCVEECTLKGMSCLIDFTNVSKMTYLDMSNCSLPGSIDLSRCHLCRLKLVNFTTEKVSVGCMEKIEKLTMNLSSQTPVCMSYDNATKLAHLELSLCSLPIPLNLSKCPLKSLILKEVKTETLTVVLMEDIFNLILDFQFTTLVCMPFSNAHTLKYLKMTNCSLADPMNLSECLLDELHLKDVKTEMVIVGCVRACTFRNMSCSFLLKDANTLIDLRFTDCDLTQPVTLSNCPLHFLELVQIDTSKFKLGSLETLTKLRISDCRFLSALPSSASNLVHVILEHCKVQRAIHYQPLTTLEIQETCGIISSIDLSKTSIKHLILHDLKISPSVFEEQMGHLYNLPRRVKCTVSGTLSYWKNKGKKLTEAIENFKTDQRYSVQCHRENENQMTSMIFEIITEH